ncbi:MAG: rRNA maturation RNase YbeY [Candidatus Marinimicrobia bacterium]|nr:rRNA maturation RNase YbeY [Candidatus Neomarinimicrobiota bacterium]MBS30100.1 rRNA maturation RNase YbeY [Candidatus Neomarinimicrobiota bacterium]
MISVTIHNDFDDKLKINKDAICKLSTEVFKREKFNNSQIDIILTDKKFLNSLKKKYFNMDVFTDVMAFNLGDDKNIDGEIYISIDDVLENSKLFSKTFNDEFKRIIIHGILHLCGYDDKTKEEKENMTLLEEKYLLLSNIVLISNK